MSLPGNWSPYPEPKPLNDDGLDPFMAVAPDPGLPDALPDDGGRSVGLTPPELLATPPAAPRFAIPQLAPRGQITTLFASIGAGKTTLYQSALVANSIQEEWLGHVFEEPQMFVVFDWENIREQVATALGRLGLSADSQGFTYYQEPEDVNLDTDKGRGRVHEILLEHGATCAIFDSRDDAFAHTPENEGDKIRSAMMATKELAGTLDVALVLVAHEPKADHAGSWDKLAGHTMWGRKSDQMFRYRRTGELRILEHAKYRAMDKRPSLKITLLTEGERDIGAMRLEAEPHASEEARAEALAKDVATLEELLERVGDLPRGEIRKMLGWSEDKFAKVFKASERVWQPGGERKAVQREPSKRGDDPCLTAF